MKKIISIIFILILFLVVGCENKPRYSEEGIAYQLVLKNNDDKEVEIYTIEKVYSKHEEYDDYEMYIVTTYTETDDDNILKQTWFVTFKLKDVILKGHSMDEIISYDCDMLHQEIYDDMEY